MRIHSISIDNFRAIEHLELNNIPDTGVVVIHGDNEQGKSSILEAIDLVLSESFKTGKQAVRGIQPVDKDVPIRVELEFSIGPYRMVVSKTYLKNKRAELRIIEPRPANHTGEDAERQLSEILESHLDKSLLTTLFMKQGDVEAGINAVGIPSLTSALNGQDGVQEDNREDTELMAAVEREYEKYFTKTGKHSKRYEGFFTEVDALRGELDVARIDVSTLSTQVDRVARLEQDRANAKAKLPEAEAELAKRRQELDAALKIKTESEEISTQLERANQQHKYALKAQADRKALHDRAQAAETALEKANAQLSHAQESAEVENQELKVRTEALSQARTQESEAIEALRTVRAIVTQLSTQARKRELATIVDSVDKLDQQILSLRTQQASHLKVAASDIEALQQATNEVKVQKALAQARGGTISLKATSTQDVEVDGKTFAVGEAEHIVDLDRALELTVGEVSISVHPGTAVVESRAEYEAAADALTELLERLDVDGIEDLRVRFDTQRRVEEDIARLETQRSSFGLQAEIESLRAEHATLDADEDEAGKTTPGISLAEAKKALDEAELHRDETSEGVRQANAALDGVRARPADKALTVISTQIEGLKDNLTAASKDLSKALEEAEDEELADSVADSRKDVEAAAAEKRRIDELLLASDPVLAEELFKGAAENLRSFQSRISEASTDLVRLEGHIAVASGASERYAKAEAALEAAENRLFSEQRRALAAQRLREVMVKHREESRKRYAAPFAEKLSRLAARVFGTQTSLNLDDQLSISSRSIGSRTVILDSLSGGAQEQLAILTRFAIADLVAESSSQGRVPVFIDDALGSTDPDRLTKISTLFGEAGKDSQVFVLTCVPERYNYVSPKTVHSIESLKSVEV